MPLMRMEHTTPAKEVTAALVGDVSGVTVFGNRVLVAIYQRPEKTASGLFLPDDIRREDQYQGKVGLVVKLGPDAFVDEGSTVFKYKAAVGDWVVFKVSDGFPLTLNDKKGHCRLLDDVDIRATVTEPDMVF